MSTATSYPPTIRVPGRPRGKRLRTRRPTANHASAAHERGAEAALEAGAAAVPARGSSTQEFSEGWILFVGALVALAATREALRRIGAHPFLARAKAPSRTDVAVAGLLLKHGLERAGSWALRAPLRTGRS